RPLRVRDLVDYSPVIEGIRYVRRDVRLLATVFVKAGLLVIGPGWIVFTVMGHRDFPVHWHGLDPQRGAMLGMSLLLGARGFGAVFSPPTLDFPCLPSPPAPFSLVTSWIAAFPLEQSQAPQA